MAKKQIKAYNLLIFFVSILLVIPLITATDISSCTTISSGGTYNLINNISSTGNCMNISADNVIFNGNGYTVTFATIGATRQGIYVSGSRTNITIINTTIKSGSSATDQVALFLENTSNSLFANNTIIYSAALNGIYFNRSLNNTFLNNNVSGDYSLRLINSTNDLLTGNTLSGTVSNYYGVGVTNLSITDQTIGSWMFSGTIIVTNTTYGKIEFLDSISSSGYGNLIPGQINISNNSAYITSGGGLDKPANITLYGIGDRGYVVPTILRNGLTCGSSCYNFTSLNTSTVSFNVTKAGNYSIGEYVPSYCMGATTNFSCGDTVTESCTLNNNIASTATCFTVGDNNIVMDGAGFEIIGDGPTIDEYGINIPGYTNITIKNFKISKFGDGIYIADSTTYSTIINNTIYSVNQGVTVGSFADYNLISDLNVYSSVFSGVNYAGIPATYNTFTNMNLTGGMYSSIYLEPDVYSTDWIIYNNSFGKINFTSATLISRVFVTTGMTYPGNIRLENNSAFVNSSVVDELNVSADITLDLNGWGITVPQILKDGIVCTDCVILDYTSNIIKFNVTSWSNYTVQNYTACFGATTNFTCGQEITESCKLNGNVNSIGTCYNITANDVVFDGNGYNITGNQLGTASHGITAVSVSGLTIKNVSIYNFGAPTTGSSGIYFDNVTYSIVNNVTCSHNAYNFQTDAFSIAAPDTSNYNNITNSIFYDAPYGVAMSLNGHYNILQNITTNSNNGTGGAGIEIYGQNNTIVNWVSDYDSVGLNLAGNNNNVTNATITHNRFDSATITASYSYLKNITFQDIPGGIAITGSYNLLDMINMDEYCTSASYGALGAITVITGSQNTLNNSVLTVAGDPASDAIYIADSSNNTINNVSIYNAPSYGSAVHIISAGDYALGNNITNSYINGSRGYGLYINTDSGGLYDNTLIENNTIDYSATDGIHFQVVTYSSIINNNLTGNAKEDANYAGIYLDNADNCLIENNAITDSANDIIISSSAPSESNIFLNNNLTKYGISGKAIDDTSTGTNTFLYNNYFGQINWTDATIFLNNLTLTHDIVFGTEIIISNNTAYLKSEDFTDNFINSSANITLNGKVNNLNHLRIEKDGVLCDDCFNFTPLNSDVIKFNVSSWSKYNVSGDSVSISSIGWKTTGGFTSSNLKYSMVLDYVNASCNNGDGCNITVLAPDSTIIVDNIAMTNTTASNFTYDTDILLNQLGLWTVNITTFYEGNTLTSSDIINVTGVQSNIVDFFYGYDSMSIPPNDTVTNLAYYDYNLLEFRDNATNLNANWSKMKDAIITAYNLNMKVGLTYQLDYNLSTDTSARDMFISNITDKFDELLATQYIQTVIYLRLVLSTTESYTDANITTNNINMIAKAMYDITQNEFLIHSDYNSSTLDTDYIIYNSLVYVTAPDESGLINALANISRNITSRTRIYYNLTNAQKQVGLDYQNIINVPLLSEYNISTSNPFKLVSEMTNGGYVVYNNESSMINVTYDLANTTGIIGKDVWDYSNHILLHNNSNGTITFINIPAYQAVLVGMFDLDKIKMTSLTQANVKSASTDRLLNSNFTDDIRDSASQVDSSPRYVEEWDKSYMGAKVKIYYGFLNVTNNPYTFNNSHYVIIADKNDAEVDKLLNGTVNITYGLYGYMAVADYKAAPSSCNHTWVAAKKAEVDSWLAINESMNIFVDGFDLGDVQDTGCFFDDVKNLSDYIKITKQREEGVNVFTNYQEFSQLSSDNGFAMFESCTHKWAYTNGVNASEGYNYSNQYWVDYAGVGTGDFNKSVWYATHNVRTLCVAFDDKNDTAYLPNDYMGSGTDIYHNGSYEQQEQLWLKAKVLGHDYFFLGTPNFNIVHYDKFYEVGTKLQLIPTENGDLYSMRYSNGIAYYNRTSDYAWFEDGRTFNNASVKLTLFDDVAHTYNICVNTYCGYSITTAGDGWSYDEYTLYLNQTVFDTAYGHYVINVSNADGGYIGDDNDTTSWDLHSFWINAGTWTKFTNGNHMVKLIINDTYKTVADTTDKITQSSSSLVNYRTNITLSSAYPFNALITTYPYNFTTTFRKVSVYNGTGFVNVSYLNSTTCTTDNPLFTTTTVSSIGDVGVCRDNTTDTFIVEWPSLSNRIFQLNGDYAVPIKTVSYPTSSFYLRTSYSGEINFSLNEEGTCVLNDTQWTAISAPNTTFHYVNATTFTFANYSVNISCWDEDLNNASTIINFEIGNYAPRIVSMHPYNTETINSSYDGWLNITILDEETDSNCTINATQWNFSSSNSSYVSFINNTPITPATYSVLVNCSDKYNYSNTTTLNFVYPSPTLPASGGGGWFYSTKYNYCGNHICDKIFAYETIDNCFQDCKNETDYFNTLLSAGNITANQITTDTDNDGLTDAQELYIYHTDPNNPDSVNGNQTDYESIENQSVTIPPVSTSSTTNSNNVWFSLIAILITIYFLRKRNK